MAVISTSLSIIMAAACIKSAAVRFCFSNTKKQKQRNGWDYVSVHIGIRLNRSFCVFSDQSQRLFLASHHLQFLFQSENEFQYPLRLSDPS